METTELINEHLIKIFEEMGFKKLKTQNKWYMSRDNGIGISLEFSTKGLEVFASLVDCGVLRQTITYIEIENYYFGFKGLLEKRLNLFEMALLKQAGEV